MRRQTNTLSILIPCLQCSEPFHPRSDLLKQGKGRYCSVQCSGAAHRTKQERACNRCGDSYTARADALAKGEGLYCSRTCAARSGAVTPPEIRYWKYVDKRGPDECWPWVGGCFDGRYGAFAIDSTHTIGAHLFAYMLGYDLSAIPRGQYVCHTCDWGICQNPAHLFLGSTQENSWDRHAKERDARGEGHGMAKLTATSVIEMRVARTNGATLIELAEQYGVTKTTVSQIVNRKTWRHVP